MAAKVFEMLIADHREAESLLKTLIQQCQGDGEIDAQKLETVDLALRAHMHIEEEYLYPEARKEDEVKDLIKDGIEEHQEVKDLLEEVDPDDEPSELADTLQQILDGVKHHAGEEERQLFPKLEKLWAQDKLDDLAQKMEKLKKQDLAKK